MPARSRKSRATSAQHAAKKSKQVHGEPSSTSPSEVVDPMDVEHGEPMRTTVPIRPDPALSADAMPAPRHSHWHRRIRWLDLSPGSTLSTLSRHSLDTVDTVDTGVNRHHLDTTSTPPTLVSTSVDIRDALMLSTGVKSVNLVSMVSS